MLPACMITTMAAAYAVINGEPNPLNRLPIGNCRSAIPAPGDIFTAVLIGGLLQGRTLQESVKLSADFICHAVEDAIKAAEPVRDGVQLEKNLYRLCAVK